MVDGGTAHVGDDVGRRQLQRSLGTPNSMLEEFDFWDGRYEGRRLFSELFGTFLLVLVAVGGGMVSARFGGSAVPYGALVVAPALMVAAIILFMGAVSGAHLNPAVSIAFALRGDFPWRRVPAYVVAQLLGAVLATLLLWALIGEQGAAGLTLPGDGISTTTAMLWEVVLTVGLVSTILGVSSGAQQLGPIAAIGVGSYIALAGLWGSPVSGASMNPARSLGPALVLGDWTSWWAYLVGPIIGAVIAVGIAYVLRGPGGGSSGRDAAQGTLGETWRPGRIGGAPADGAAARRRPAGPLRTPLSWGSTSTWPGRPVPRRGRCACPAGKIVVPELPAEFTPRRPLRRRLDEAAPDQVIVVSAPAGSGKTLLLADWVREERLARRRPGSRWTPTTTTPGGCGRPCWPRCSRCPSAGDGPAAAAARRVPRPAGGRTSWRSSPTPSTTSAVPCGSSSTTCTS